MNKTILFIAIIFLLSNCKKDNDDSCNVEDPLTELNWMKELQGLVDISCNSCQISIFQAIYKGQTVFYTASTAPACNVVFKINLLNCDGQKVKTFDNSNQDEFDNLVMDKKELYGCF